MSRTAGPQNADYPVNPDYLADPYPYFVRFRREAPIFYAPEIDITWGRQPPEEPLEIFEKMTSFFDYIENFAHEQAQDLRDDYTSDLLKIRAEDEGNLSLDEVVSSDYSAAGSHRRGGAHRARKEGGERCAHR